MTKSPPLPDSLPITVRGVAYTLLFTDDLPPEQDGLCDSPRNRAPRFIKIRKTLRGKRMLEIILHELRHAQDFDLDEQVVTDIAEEEADLLWQLGYRLRPPKPK